MCDGHHEAVAILRQRVSQVIKLGFLTGTFAVQLRFGVSAAGMGQVGALLAVKVHFGIPRLKAVRILSLTVLVGVQGSLLLYSAIIREISAKGKDSRFVKAERGKFAAK